MEYEIIYHSGIKGMKWGVRRYQNPDGSLTPAGKKRYNKTLEKVRAEEKALREKAKAAKTTEATKSKIDKLNARVDAVNKKNQALKDGKKLPDDKPKTEAEKEAEKKAYEEAKDKAIKSGSATEVLKFKGDLTPQEMQAVSNRIQWEQNMQGISAKEMASGKTKADKFFEGVDKATNRVNTAAKAWNTAANVINAFGGLDVSLPKIDTNITNSNKDVRQKEKKEKKKAEDAAKKRAEQESQKESKQKERAEKRAKEAKAHEGTVSGEGTSKGSSDRQKSGPVVDVDWSDVPMSSVSDATRASGKAYVDSMLALPAPREERKDR